MFFSTELANKYFAHAYATNSLLEDIKRVCDTNPDACHIPEELMERLQESLKFLEEPVDLA